MWNLRRQGTGQKKPLQIKKTKIPKYQRLETRHCSKMGTFCTMRDSPAAGLSPSSSEQHHCSKNAAEGCRTLARAPTALERPRTCPSASRAIVLRTTRSGLLLYTPRCYKHASADRIAQLQQLPLALRGSLPGYLAQSVRIHQTRFSPESIEGCSRTSRTHDGQIED